VAAAADVLPAPAPPVADPMAWARGAAPRAVMASAVNTAGPNSLVLTRRFLPTWAIVVAIIGAFFLLLGLLLLLVRTTETLTVTLAEADGGTRVTISGLATTEMMARLNAVIGGTKSA
jgi:hypothetical protein